MQQALILILAFNTFSNRGLVNVKNTQDISGRNQAKNTSKKQDA